MKVLEISTKAVKRIAWVILVWCFLWMVLGASTGNWFGVFVNAIVGAVWTNILSKTKKLEKLEAKIAAEYQAKLVKKEEEPK